VVSAPKYTPDRGDLVWLEFDPQAGHEQRGRRPALVLSPRAYNGKVGLAIVCPLTTQLKGYPFEVVVAPRPSSSHPSVVLADQAKSLDWRVRRARRFGRASKETVLEVVAKLSALIGVTP
jgi:mRNA interferase MazF